MLRRRFQAAWKSANLELPRHENTALGSERRLTILTLDAAAKLDDVTP